MNYEIEYANYGNGMCLNEKYGIYLYRNGYEQLKTGKIYLTDMCITFVDTVWDSYIAKSFQETIQFREELMLFHKGDERNTFLCPAIKKIDGKTIYSLALEKDEKTTIYLSNSEAKSIAQLINYSISGLFFTKNDENIRKEIDDFNHKRIF